MYLHFTFPSNSLEKDQWITFQKSKVIKNIGNCQ